MERDQIKLSVTVGIAGAEDVSAAEQWLRRGLERILEAEGRTIAKDPVVSVQMIAFTRDGT